MQPGKYRFCSVYNPDRSIDTSSERLHRSEGPLQLYRSNETMYQRFLVAPHPQRQGAFTIRSVIDAKFWGVAGDSDQGDAEIQFQERRDGPYQTWYFEPEAATSADTYRIRNAGSGLYLSVVEETLGTHLVQSGDADNPKVRFRIIPA
jgi:Ricin-type beta-trefoil lectin domain-like